MQEVWGSSPHISTIFLFDIPPAAADTTDMGAQKFDPATYDFSGVWRSVHYKAGDDPANAMEHYLVLRLIGNQLIMESISSLTGGSYLLARFTLSGMVATGSYQRQVSSQQPDDEALALYYGAAQLVFKPKTRTFSGQGVGFNRYMHVQNTIWQITKVGKRPAPAKPAKNRRQYGII